MLTTMGALGWDIYLMVEYGYELNRYCTDIFGIWLAEIVIVFSKSLTSDLIVHFFSRFDQYNGLLRSIRLLLRGWLSKTEWSALLVPNQSFTNWDHPTISNSINPMNPVAESIEERPVQNGAFAVDNQSIQSGESQAWSFSLKFSLLFTQNAHYQ